MLWSIANFGEELIRSLIVYVFNKNDCPQMQRIYQISQKGLIYTHCLQDSLSIILAYSTGGACGIHCTTIL